jgi:hypothetical protein
MAVTLLPLSDGHSSLEFEPADIPSMASAIRDRYGEIHKRHYAMSTEYRFGGCSFTFQNERDDPCLISASAEGDEILTTLYATLNASR